MIRRQTLSKSNSFPVGLTLFLSISLFFMIRFVGVFLANDVGGSHAYAQIINAGLPIVKATYYDEESYEEFVTIESVIKETLWLDKINPVTILAAEIPVFELFSEKMVGDLMDNNGEKINVTSESNDIDSFVLSDENIKKEESKVSEDGIRNPEIIKTLDQSNPRVLIWNTHSSEAYSVDRNFTDDVTKNVVGVTELIVKELEEYYGIATIYDRTKHDTMYTKSYERSRETAKKYASEYPNGFDLVVDLHRDGVGKTNKKPVTTTLNGESVARIMFVESLSATHYSANHASAKRMLALADTNFQGFSRGIKEYQNGQSKFQQDIMPNTVLIEVGGESNTPEEAQASAKYIARLIAEEVHYKSQTN